LRAIPHRLVDEGAEAGACIFELPSANRLGHSVLRCSHKI
jgi:hypothetical protein